MFKRDKKESVKSMQKQLNEKRNKEPEIQYTAEDINDYVGKVVSKGNYSEAFKDVIADDMYMVQLNEGIELKEVLHRVSCYFGIKDTEEIVNRVNEEVNLFNWLTRDIILLAHINKYNKLGNPRVCLRPHTGVVIPSVILCGEGSQENEYSFIIGYIVHRGLGYEMQETKYGDRKAYAPYRYPLDKDNDLVDVIAYLNYQYTLIY